MALRLKPDVLKRVVWSRPDSRIIPFCSLCYRHIPADDVPLMMWRNDGACIQFCDDCAEASMEAVP